MLFAASAALEVDRSAECDGRQCITNRSAQRDILQEAQLRLRQEARLRLAASPYRCLREIECDCNGDVVLLRGKLPSYFFKQLAQELLRNLSGCSGVENQTEVLLHEM